MLFLIFYYFFCCLFATKNVGSRPNHTYWFDKKSYAILAQRIMKEVNRMKWKKIITTLLIITTVTLFVITVRLQDSNMKLKEQLGVEYSQDVAKFTNYAQDMQSANGSGDIVNSNHFYEEINNFPIQNNLLNREMMAIYEELSNLEDGKENTSANRKQLSEDLNALQLKLIAITTFADSDSMKWYAMVNDENSEIQQVINDFYEKSE